ncbi:MAG: YqgE/AlgH family protein [Actinobacteria bacterium]|nr:YqgE/AlgH family protein [Actinomycetota bacterium]
MEVAIAPGTLLIASIGLSDGVFDGSVVLLLDADESGTVGVVLNKLTTIELERALPQWAELVGVPHALFDGGPVSQQGAICLARPADPADEPPGWRPLFEHVGLLNLDTPIEIAEGAYRDLRIFAGYAGWDAGQLETELAAEMWYPVPALEADAFDPDPATLWRRVLRRQGGNLALFSTWTADAESN